MVIFFVHPDLLQKRFGNDWDTILVSRYELIKLSPLRRVISEFGGVDTGRAYLSFFR